MSSPVILGKSTNASKISIQRTVLLTAVVLLVVKMLAYYYTNSVAILTDALESIVNVIAALFGLYGLQIAAIPRDSNHPYGHGKIEFIASAVEGVLIILAGAYMVYEAVVQYIAHNTPTAIPLGVALTLVTVIANGALGLWCISKAKVTNSVILASSGKHLLADTLTTLGIILALGIIYVTKWYWVDVLVAGIVAIWLIITGVKIIKTSVDGIMDKADEVLLQNVIQTINANRNTNWVDVHNLRIVKYGTVLHIDAHLTLPWYFNVLEAHKEIEQLTAMVQQHYGALVELFVHTDACLPTSCAICNKQDCNVRQHAFEQTIIWQVSNVISNVKHNIGS